MNTMMNTITMVGNKAQYDERAKCLIAQKMVLAHILVRTVDEFKNMNPEEAVLYIEGEPQVGSVPLDPGMTNLEKVTAAGERIIGYNTENSEINEGMVRFDIIFYVRMKDGLSQIIINIEIQKDQPTQYKILNRAIFYVGRQISSQKGRDFVNSNYDDMKSVYSIWICLNMSVNSMTHIYLTQKDILEPYKWNGRMDLVNIILLGISRDLPPVKDGYELNRLLGTLLSNKLQVNEKLEIIKNEYNIPVNDQLREDVGVMCNLSQGIVDETKVRIIINMYRKGYTLEQIADITEKSIADIQQIIAKEAVSV